MTQVNVFDSGVCSLGEGALWHPTRNQFFWFDINNNALFSQEEGHASAGTLMPMSPPQDG